MDANPESLTAQDSVSSLNSVTISTTNDRAVKVETFRNRWPETPQDAGILIISEDEDDDDEEV